MAVTQNSYTGDGSTTNYSFTFPYLKASDIKASIDAVDTTAFTLANATTVQFNTAPSDGAQIKIFRETGIDNLTATFYAGSAIKSEDLNENFTQNLYVTQEVNGRYLSSLGGTMVGNLNFDANADVVFEGSTANDFETTLTVVNPTADRTITLPNVTGTVVTTGDTGTVATGMIADDAVTMAKLNSGVLPTDITVASANIVDGTIVNADVNAAAAIDGTKVNPAFGSQNITTTGTAATGAHTVTGNIVVSGTVDGRDVAADGTKLDGIETAATADQTAAEIRTLVENATDSNVFTDADHTKLNGIDTGATDDQTASEIKTLIASSPLDSSHLATNSVSTAKIEDAELTTLAGMRPATASILASGTDLTADIADINQIDGMAKETSITDDDTKFPTSGAVVDYVAAQIAPIGGLEVIATEVAFPNTQPSSGVVISISDAAGVVVNGSGTSTTGRTVGGSTVTINNFPSSLNSETLATGVGLMVSSTGSSQIYNYHKLLAAETDVKQLSDDINDFQARYRIGSSDPTSANDEGDLFFNTAANKMKVYDGSAWGEVTSTGDFKFLVLTDAGTTNAATFNGSNTSFDLKEGTTSGSATSVTTVFQVLLVLNGVVQKPNSGSYDASGEGFYLTDSDTIRFATAPPSGSSVFAVLIGSSTTIQVPADNTVSTAKLQSGAVTTDKIGTTGVSAGTVGSSTAIPIITVNDRGQVTNTSTTAIDSTSIANGSSSVAVANNSSVTVTAPELKLTTPFFEMPQTITANKTITNNHNCLTVGPVTINSGITVTVGDGENWVIV